MEEYEMVAHLIVQAVKWVVGLLLVLFIAYAMMFYGGGDPIKRMFLSRQEGGQTVSEADMARIRAQYGLDKPFPVQFVNYLSHLVQGDFGRSIIEQRDVGQMIKARLPISLQIGLAATLLVTVIGIPLGVLAALKHNSWLDSLVVGMLVLLNAVPIFVTGPLLLLLFVIVLKVMDVPFGWKGLFHPQVILPVALMTLGPLPIVVRQTRAAMLEVLSEDYVRTARAKGLHERVIVFRHMLRPMLAPVITTLGLVMTTLVNGAIFVELIFSIPGFGNLTLQGLQQVDYPIILGTVLVGAIIVILSNLLVDLVYPLIDPRLRHNA
jgi:ABC-type dipeptide/oligopeptide/nickel transport system permease component